jgi:hypothetical protein
MDIIEATPDRSRIDIGMDQLLILNSALNEVCNGLDLWEFETRMGVDRPTAKALLAEIHSLILKMRESSET